jgi:hypothetical protein
MFLFGSKLRMKRQEGNGEGQNISSLNSNSPPILGRFGRKRKLI